MTESNGQGGAVPQGRYLLKAWTELSDAERRCVSSFMSQLLHRNTVLS
jgi:hypothetical protein